MAEEEEGVEMERQEPAHIKGGQPAENPPPRKPYKPQCVSLRIDELARPKKWILLANWRAYHEFFDEERMQRFKERVQEEFSMTPEETEEYFAKLRKHIQRHRSKKAMERQLRREKMLARKEAYKLFRKRLRKALKYAFEHQPPAIVSPMFRDLSDNILEKLAELHCVTTPKRDCTDKTSVFLISIADWAAKLASNIYYEVEVFERADTERFKQEAGSEMSLAEKSEEIVEEELAEDEIDEEEEEEGEEEEEEEEEEENRRRGEGGATRGPTGEPTGEHTGEVTGEGETDVEAELDGVME